jgi:hypothetical protein
MNPLDRLSEYLRRIERRLRVLVFTRGAALTAVAALAFTVLAVLLSNHFAFSDPSVLWARILLFLGLALALGLGLIVPMIGLTRRKAAREAEQKFPQFEERLLTFSERPTGQNDPFLELLASDTLELAKTAEPHRVAAKSRICSFAGAAAVALAVLVWLGTSGPGFLGYGTALLWGGLPKNEMSPFYEIVVQPGNRTVRKKADQLVTARLVGFQSPRVRVLAKYQSSSKWEEAQMAPQPGGPSYEFLFAGLPESMQYYVEAGGMRSKTYRFNVVDLPGIKRIRVTYKFPGWTGLQDAVEDPGGDLRAVEGTVAQVAIETDKPLANGQLLLEDGSKTPLRTGDGNWRIASVSIQKDGLYHIAAVEQGEEVRLSDDYFIEARKDAPPVVRLLRPGRDAKVNPIEEVTVALDAQDDFGLQKFELHYSVNGGPEKAVSLLRGKGQKQASGSATLYLEDYKMSPGDIVSLYATASDARSTTRTSMFFIEAQPFEREYTQSQQMGAGGDGGEDQNRISQRQKEIISATWNQIKEPSHDKTAAAQNAKFLGEVQTKLRDQARSLANRMRSRQLSTANQEFKSFVQDMEAAVEAMGPAAEKLRGQQWQPALAPEQKALQHLLRAEATFRNIQVAFSHGGGRGAGGMGRDLESLFDLELDTEKNQYETGQQASADQRAREIDEALQKLEQLARRQQELAREQRRNQQAFQQRWQQEMLRREAEQLQRRMEQLSRGSSGQMQQGQQGQQSQSSGQPQSGQGGQAGNSQLEQAIERLRQATRDMRQAGSSQNSGSPQSEAEARRAAERLQEALSLLSGVRQRQAGEQVDDLVRRADKLADQQRKVWNRMRQAFGSPGSLGQPQPGAQPGVSREQAEQIAREKEQMLGDVQKLEKDIEKTARDLDGAQRTASTKLREALGNLQQDEIGARMRWLADAVRRGLGQYAVMREATVAQSLNNLRDQLRRAQNALGRGTGDQKDLQQALAQAERLRQQMEQMARAGSPRQASGQQPAQQGRQGQQGQQGTQGQGQQGTQGQGQAGQPAGAGRQPGAGQPAGERLGGPQGGAWTGGGYSAMNRGDWLPAPPGSLDPAATERAYQEAMRDMSRLQHALESDPEMARDVEALIREMQRLDPKRFPGNPELVERLRSQVLAGLEQIELQLRRKVDDQQGGNVRSGAGESVPAGYAKSVAEYFRKLSKEK